jgi:hypothetical protein
MKIKEKDTYEHYHSSIALFFHLLNRTKDNILMMVDFLKEFRYKISRFILIDILDQKGNQLPLDVIDYKVREKSDLMLKENLHFLVLYIPISSITNSKCQWSLYSSRLVEPYSIIFSFRDYRSSKSISSCSLFFHMKMSIGYTNGGY